MQSCPHCNAPNQDTAKFCGQCGQSLGGPLSTDAMLQGRYQITQLLGQGGMGAVYQAQDTRLGGRLVAVKENFDTSPEAQTQFELEATTLANLNHPHLPRVSDHFIEPSGKQYLVMDYVGGKDLEEILVQRGAVPESEALAWFDQVCEALAYMHSQRPPIIHRDIKPANIKITPAGNAMLVDFGIAKVYQHGQRTQTAAQAVTPHFSPPEQYGFARTDARSDIYALGATLYCMLTANVPPDAMDRLTAGDQLASPRQVNSSISQSTQDAILWSLELNPVNRPDTVEELRQALDQQPQVYSPPPKPASSAASAPPTPKPKPISAPKPAPAPTPAVAPYQFASFGRRFLAFLVDGFILSMAAGLLGGLLDSIGASDDIVGLAVLIVFLGYFPYFYSRSGQTPGKKLTRIRVIATDRSIPGIGRSIVRTFGYVFSLSLSVYLIGLLSFGWAYRDEKNQTLYDKLAKTYVVEV